MRAAGGSSVICMTARSSGCVHAVTVQKLALRALAHGEANAGELMAEALRYTEQANAELRELAHGILPAALIRGGLQAGVEALVSRAPLPVSVDVAGERLPAGVEATAYFVISEALTNVVKHAHAAGAWVTARVERGELRVEVGDDGIGGHAAVTAPVWAVSRTGCQPSMGGWCWRVRRAGARGCARCCLCPAMVSRREYCGGR